MNTIPPGWECVRTAYLGWNRETGGSFWGNKFSQWFFAEFAAFSYLFCGFWRLEIVWPIVWNVVRSMLSIRRLNVCLWIWHIAHVNQCCASHARMRSQRNFDSRFSKDLFFKHYLPKLIVCVKTECWEHSLHSAMLLFMFGIQMSHRARHLLPKPSYY